MKQNHLILSFIFFLFLIIFPHYQVNATSFYLGNNSENILNGGVIAYEDGNTYCSDQNASHYLYVLTENNTKTLLSKDSCSYINLSNNRIYYVNNQTEICSIDKNGKNKQVLFKSKTSIKDFYLVNDSFYFISDGNIHCYKVKDEIISKDGNISHMIPTSSGIIYAKGSLLNWTLYANGNVIEKNVTSFYTVDDYLYFTKENKNKQISVSKLFNTDNPSKYIEDYKDNEKDVELSDIDSVALEEKGELVTAEDKENEVTTLSNNYTSLLSKVSKGQQNIVKRAMQMHEIKWTPKKDIKSWNNAYTFKAGTTYSGLPYGQPVNASYVPWKTSLSEFITMVDNSSSKMYTSRSTYNKTAPYYSNDCSAFVSWAWQTTSRKTTSSLSSVANKVATQSIYGVEIGDSLVYAGSHTVLVTDVGYDASGNLAYIDITEQTPPQTKKTRYGADGEYPLSTLTSKYFKSKYILYRSKTRDSVTYTHNCDVRLEGDTCTKCASTISNPIIQSITKNTNGTLISWQATKGATYLVYRKTPNQTPKEDYTLLATTTTASYLDTTSSNDSTYLYYIKIKNTSYDDTGIWIDSPTTTKTQAKTDGNYLEWSDITGCDKYYVYRDGQKIAETTDSNYIDGTFASATTYKYAVSAIYSYKESRLSSSVSLKSVTITKLSTPKLKSATSSKITWDKVANAQGYYVYRKEPNGSFKKIATTTSTSYTDTAASKTKAYYYMVKAYNGLTTSSSSNSILRKATLSISAKNVSNGIKIQWSKANTDVVYKLYRRQKKTASWKLYATIGSTAYTNTKVTLQQNYQYAVKAYYKNTLISNQANSSLITHKLVAPTLKTSVNKKKVTLTIGKVSGATKYQIYRKTKTGSWKKMTTTTKLTYTNTFSKSGSYYYRVQAYYTKNEKTYYSPYVTSSLAKIK